MALTSRRTSTRDAAPCPPLEWDTNLWEPLWCWRCSSWSGQREVPAPVPARGMGLRADGEVVRLGGGVQRRGPSQVWVSRVSREVETEGGGLSVFSQFHILSLSIPHSCRTFHRHCCKW